MSLQFFSYSFFCFRFPALHYPSITPTVCRYIQDNQELTMNPCSKANTFHAYTILYHRNVPPTNCILYVLQSVSYSHYKIALHFLWHSFLCISSIALYASCGPIPPSHQFCITHMPAYTLHPVQACMFMHRPLCPKLWGVFIYRSSMRAWTTLESKMVAKARQCA